jgi:hypothetical protein
MTAKEILAKVKAVFVGEQMPPTAPAPTAPTAKSYKTTEGTEISVTQAGELPAPGDAVTINGAPAPEGILTLEGGATITVDAAGIVTAYTPAVAMAAPPVPPAPPAPPTPVTLSAEPKPLTAEEVNVMLARFATGTPEERITNLETMVKALMECNFGWEIRKGQEQTAIQTYKDTLAGTQTQVAQAATQMASQKTTIDEQATTIARHEKTIEGLFELVEKLTELPTAEPVTLSGAKKEKFDNQNKREERIQKMAEAMQQLKKEAKTQPA